MIRQFHESIVLKGTKGIIQKSAKISSKDIAKKKKKKKIYSQQNELYVHRTIFFSGKSLWRTEIKLQSFGIFSCFEYNFAWEYFFYNNPAIKKESTKTRTEIL